jgi:hypothetical protein
MPAKAGRALENTISQQTVAIAPGTMPLGFIVMWKSRMLTMTGAINVSASGT